MDGWFETFLDKILIVFFAIFGGAARFAIAPPTVRSMWGCVGSLVIAGFAGILAWQLLEGLGFSTQTVAAGVGIAGLLGDDILKAILKLGVRLREDPLRFLDKFLKSRFGMMFTSAHSTYAREIDINRGDGEDRKEKGATRRKLSKSKIEDVESETEWGESDRKGGKEDRYSDDEILQTYNSSDEESIHKNWELVGVPDIGHKTTHKKQQPRKIKRSPTLFQCSSPDAYADAEEEDGGLDQ